MINICAERNALIGIAKNYPNKAQRRTMITSLQLLPPSTANPRVVSFWIHREEIYDFFITGLVARKLQGQNDASYPDDGYEA